MSAGQATTLETPPANGRPFKVDYDWQLDKRDRILKPAFYDQVFPGRYVFLDGDSPLTKDLQQSGADTLVSEDSAARFVEEKIVHFPESGRHHHRFAIELESNGVLHTRGWFYKCRADYLLYCFAQTPDPVYELVAYWIPFPPFAAWFREEWATFSPFGPSPGSGRLVPIADVQRRIPGVKEFKGLRDPNWNGKRSPPAQLGLF